MKLTSSTAPFWKPFVLALGLAATGATASLHAAPADQPAPDARPVMDTSTCSRPEYPAEEAAQKHTGTSTWHFLIGPDGKVVETRLGKSSGYPALDEAARAALVKCRFRPPLYQGKPARAWVPVQYVWGPE